ncbi:transposase [Texcoconibacillus texcoconensis]|uniref:Transposase n=1 Tax=Texcoconibacillus texcoconensis TaxID=1095777 RepID=A0A840QSD8_9BACI|nr:transposase [Texcoconibacillus texcoconensis]MBB5174426.1 transposase [Texcoconibacillus texcoconensis]
MSIVRQESLFSIEVLYELEPTQRYDEVFSSINIAPMVNVVAKKSRFGRPVSLNYPAMIQALVIRIVERISEIKLLVKRLKWDLQFKWDCGFLISDSVPSESAFSRMISKIKESNVLQSINTQILTDAIDEGCISDTNIAIDAGHFEARDQASSNKEEREQKSVPKKRGRKPKIEQEQWLKEQQELQDSLPIFEKKIEDQLEVPYNELRDQMPIAPKWGVKKNSEGKNAYWFGYKGHFAVDTKNQFILHSMMSSGNLHDGKAITPLLKGIEETLPKLDWTYAIMDAGYDYKPIYEQINNMNDYSIIAYNKKNESEPIGFDSHFAPTCVREHSYRYDSFDKKYKTLKFTRPKECADCPLAHDTLCQKVYKIKVETDLRRYSAPARGSLAWKERYKERSSVERVIGYLKEFFQLNNVRYRTGERAKVQFDLTTMVYNGMKLASARLNHNAVNSQTVA